MYLLSTDAVVRLVRGADDDVNRFIEQARESELPVFASMVSFALLHLEIDSLPAGAQRDIWKRRYDIAASKFERDRAIAETPFEAVRHWSTLASQPINNNKGEDIGEMERLVIATAAARQWRLLMSDSLLADELKTMVNIETEIL